MSKYLLNVKQASFTNDTVKHMGNSSDMAMEAKVESKISDYRYDKAMRKITLLKLMQEIDNKEVKRLINLLESPDGENWVVAEECIKQKLS